MNLTYFRENAINYLNHVICSLNLKITSRTWKEQLSLHSGFPSLLSYKNTGQLINLSLIKSAHRYEQSIKG